MKGYLALVGLAIAGGGSYAAVSRADHDTLMMALAVGMAAGLPLTVAIVVVVVLVAARSGGRPAEQPGGWERERPTYEQPQPQYTRPMIIPPMMIAPSNSRQQQQASWAEAPGPRRYTMIGDEAEG